MCERALASVVAVVEGVAIAVAIVVATVETAVAGVHLLIKGSLQKEREREWAFVSVPADISA